jgi:hypothetical protein
MQLFDEGEAPIPLKLISSETFETGVLNLAYAPAESAGNAGYEDAKIHLPGPNGRSPAEHSRSRPRLPRSLGFRMPPPPSAR